MATNGMGTEASLHRLDDRVDRLESSVEVIKDHLETRLDALIEAVGTPPNRALGTLGKGLVGAVSLLIEESEQRARESKERTNRLLAWEKRFNWFVSLAGLVAAGFTIYFYATGKKP